MVNKVRAPVPGSDLLEGFAGVEKDGVFSRCIVRLLLSIWYQVSDIRYQVYDVKYQISKYDSECECDMSESERNFRPLKIIIPMPGYINIPNNKKVGNFSVGDGRARS